MKNHDSKSMSIYAIIFMFFIALLLLSCDDHDESRITVCNLDNNEYEVELRREADDSLVSTKHVEDIFDPFDHCNSFDNVDEGRYYLVVLDGGNNVVDQSDDFYLDDGERRTFTIDTSGDIFSDPLFLNQATVSVCNQDDDMHRVALKRSSDDRLVAGFDLEHQQDALDHCNDFEGLDEGNYYIEIDADDNQKADRSDDFYLAPNENQSFTLTIDGKIMAR